ncbi:MAG: hypothetical protein JW950_09585 [Deltaproteobacteria bacterium]|nr:hypothetical protein [Deltaproteobacteria bacterium]
MAEIKSTMELALEKTKNLTLSEEEKKALQASEWTGKVRGLVQKYLDDAIGITQLKSALSEDKKAIERLRDILEMELLDNIQPDSDDINEKIFQIFRDILERNPESLVQAVRNVQQDLERERQKHFDHLKEELQNRGIHGSAVLPNLSKSDLWTTQLNDLSTAFHQSIKEFSKRRSL